MYICPRDLHLSLSLIFENELDGRFSSAPRTRRCSSAEAVNRGLFLARCLFCPIKTLDRKGMDVSTSDLGLEALARNLLVSARKLVPVPMCMPHFNLAGTCV